MCTRHAHSTHQINVIQQDNPSFSPPLVVQTEPEWKDVNRRLRVAIGRWRESQSVPPLACGQSPQRDMRKNSTICRPRNGGAHQEGRRTAEAREQPESAAQPTTGGGKKRGAAKSATATVVPPDAIAASVKAKHPAGTLSLVICNTVNMVYDMGGVVFGRSQGAHHMAVSPRVLRTCGSRGATRYGRWAVARRRSTDCLMNWAPRLGGL